MSAVVLSDIERFTAKRIILIRVKTHLSAMKSTTNIRVAFQIRTSNRSADVTLI